MKAWRGVMIVALWAVAALPSLAAVAERVDYVSGAKPDDAACRWEAGMVSAAAASIKSASAEAGSPPPGPAPSLALKVADLKVSRSGGKGKYAVVVRGEISRDGKLLATRDFQDDTAFKSDQAACDTLLKLGASLGESAGEWAAKTRLMKCDAPCDGIHPDEPIVVGAGVLIGSPGALNDTVRDECRWPTAMVAKLVSAFNQEHEPPLRARLDSRTIDIETYPGRRLVLRVIDMHALAGGGFSGPKWLDMTGELWDGPAMAASFDLHTGSGRGLTTCRSVDSLSDSATDMIVEWLRNPTLRATLN